MQFQFTETMRGRVVKPDSIRLSFEFTITAQARGYIAYALGDPLDVSGTASLEEVATRVPVTGFLHIAMPLSRQLRYDLSFRTQDGALYRYMGRKNVRYLRFFRTMSWLKGTLFRNGELMGQAELWFDYRGLLSFILSFRPGILPVLWHAVHRLRLLQLVRG